MLDLNSAECAFLVNPNIEPGEDYTERELFQMKSLVMAYIMSNLEMDLQRLIKDVDDPVEALEMIERAVDPPTQAKEHALQIEFMNIRFNSSIETTLEFQNRFKGLVEGIRRCPGAELTERAIRRNLINAISEECPRITDDALQEGSQLTVANIFDRMFAMFDMMAENDRRESARGKAFHGMNKNKALKKRKASWPEKGASSSKMEKMTCYKCGVQGHMRSNCRNPEKMCYNCGEFGHLSAQCNKPASKFTLQNKKAAGRTYSCPQK